MSADPMEAFKAMVAELTDHTRVGAVSRDYTGVLRLAQFLASDGAREALARTLALAEWPVATEQERLTYAEKRWGDYLRRADALLTTLAEKATAR